MYDGTSYAPPFTIGAPLEGRAVGEIVATAVDGYEVGDLVLSTFGWREVFNTESANLARLDVHGLPPQAFLGVAGIIGLTAYAGLVRIGRLKSSDTVFISAAAGAVGSAACQFAKARGCRVVGSAGGPKKTAFLKELGIDEVIDYKSVPSLPKALAAAAPGGIDVYFDNVGGAHLEAAIACANMRARFVICGMMDSQSVYNTQTPNPGPRNLMLMPGKRLMLEGFLAMDHQDLAPAFLDEVLALHKAGRLNLRETVMVGLERAPEALLGLFSGANIGKMLVKLH